MTREAAMSMYGGSGQGMEQEATVTKDRDPLLRHFHPTSPWSGPASFSEWSRRDACSQINALDHPRPQAQPPCQSLASLSPTLSKLC